MRRAACLVLALSTAAPIALAAAPPAHACLFSDVASAYADDIAARRVKTLPNTAQGQALWAPFAFRQHFAGGHTIHFREDMREVARSLGQDVLHWRVRWLFGDGTRAPGVAPAHIYRHAGLYKIEVQAYYTRAPQGWYDFDIIDVAVGRVPAGLMALIGTPRGMRAAGT